MKALFVIKDSKGKLINEYELDSSSPSETRELFEEARSVWHDHYVTVFTSEHVFSSKTTHSQELTLSFFKESSTFIFAE
jgi:hypothetical protein